MTNCNRKIQEAEDHYPEREDQVHQWLKVRRDDMPKGSESHSVYTLLVDEYELAADTYQSLENIVNAEWEEEQNRLKKPLTRKKKKEEARSDG